MVTFSERAREILDRFDAVGMGTRKWDGTSLSLEEMRAIIRALEPDDQFDWFENIADYFEQLKAKIDGDGS